MVSAERDSDCLELMLDLSRESCCMREGCWMGEVIALHGVCSGSFIGDWNSSVVFESCVHVMPV